MSNKVWVTWAGASRPVKVTDLADNADADDLCRKFVVDRRWAHVDAGTLSVSKKDGIEVDNKVKNYFVDPDDDGDGDFYGPGQSKDTALFVTFPLVLPNGKLRCCFCILVFKCVVASNVA
jgi:hypothetical protein